MSTFLPSQSKQRLTLAQLISYDDILTDALVDHVYYWTTIRKMRKAYHASRSIKEDQITSILQKAIILERNAAAAEMQLLALPALQRFLDGLKTDKEKDDFKKHLRRYINIYQPDCPFEVASTNRYTITSHEACIIARREIKKGETIKYLCGVQVVMTAEEEEFIKRQRRDFSVVVSSRSKTASLFLGPARFANHDCGANARLMTSGISGMEIIAARNIQIGDEVTVTYGENYFGEDNCECLCKTCEDNLVNGWKPVEGATSFVKPSIEDDSSVEVRGPITRRRRETANSSRTPSVVPELRPVVRRGLRKSLSALMASSTPIQAQLSTPSPETLPQDRDTSKATASILHHKSLRSPEAKKTDDLRSPPSRELYFTAPSSPASSNELSLFSPSGDANIMTDATSIEDSSVDVLSPAPLKRKRGRPRKYPIDDRFDAITRQVESEQAFLVKPSVSTTSCAVDIATGCGAD